MTKHTPVANSFRKAVLEPAARTLVVREKKPRLADNGIVSRSERRHGNHRDSDRHRLTNEAARARYASSEYDVELINLSGGGAMIRAPFEPRLWDVVQLELGEGSWIDCAVRWLRDETIGLEFAHETRIEADPETRARLLLDVIQRSYPDAPVNLDLNAGEEERHAGPAEEKLHGRTELRHPLVWNGNIVVDCFSYAVRLRNISESGALVDLEIHCPAGTAVALDLGAAGVVPAVVSWTRGEQAGLRFDQPFDLEQLSKLRPDFTPYRWTVPGFINAAPADAEAEDEAWDRQSMSDLRAELEGFLKR